MKAKNKTKNKTKNLAIWLTTSKVNGKTQIFVGECLKSTYKVVFGINQDNEQSENRGGLDAIIGNVKVIDDNEIINIDLIRNAYKELINRK